MNSIFKELHSRKRLLFHRKIKKFLNNFKNWNFILNFLILRTFSCTAEQFLWVAFALAPSINDLLSKLNWSFNSLLQKRVTKYSYMFVHTCTNMYNILKKIGPLRGHILFARFARSSLRSQLWARLGRAIRSSRFALGLVLFAYI